MARRASRTVRAAWAAAWAVPAPFSSSSLAEGLVAEGLAAEAEAAAARGRRRTLSTRRSSRSRTCTTARRPSFALRAASSARRARARAARTARSRPSAPIARAVESRSACSGLVRAWSSSSRARVTRARALARRTGMFAFHRPTPTRSRAAFWRPRPASYSSTGPGHGPHRSCERGESAIFVLRITLQVARCPGHPAPCVLSIAHPYCAPLSRR